MVRLGSHSGPAASFSVEWSEIRAPPVVPRNALAVVLPACPSAPGLLRDANDEPLIETIGRRHRRLRDRLAGPTSSIWASPPTRCSRTTAISSRRASRRRGPPMPPADRELDLVFRSDWPASPRRPDRSRARIDPDHALRQSHADSTTDALRRPGSIALTGAANHLRDACGHRMTPEIDRDRMLSIRRTGSDGTRSPRNTASHRPWTRPVPLRFGWPAPSRSGQQRLPRGHCHPCVVEALSGGLAQHQHPLPA